MVTVPQQIVGLERILDYKGVGLYRFHYTTEPQWFVICRHWAGCQITVFAAPLRERYYAYILWCSQCPPEKYKRATYVCWNIEMSSRRYFTAFILWAFSYMVVMVPGSKGDPVGVSWRQCTPTLSYLAPHFCKRTSTMWYMSGLHLGYSTPHPRSWSSPTPKLILFSYI